MVAVNVCEVHGGRESTATRSAGASAIDAIRRAFFSVPFQTRKPAMKFGAIARDRYIADGQEYGAGEIVALIETEIPLDNFVSSYDSAIWTLSQSTKASHCDTTPPRHQSTHN